jgi:hypothetical protein
MRQFSAAELCMILGNNENNVEFKKKNVWLEEKISSMSPR